MEYEKSTPSQTGELGLTLFSGGVPNWGGGSDSNRRNIGLKIDVKSLDIIMYPLCKFQSDFSLNWSLKLLLMSL